MSGFFKDRKTRRVWNDHAHGIAWMWQNHLDWKTRCRAPWKTVQCYWNNTTWRANEREFTLEQNSFLVLNKITFRSMGNQKGSWWRTSGKPWCQNWLNAFIACWILRANVDEISSSIRYACTSITMGERYIFNDASSWLTVNYFFFSFFFCTIFIVLLFLVQARNVVIWSRKSVGLKCITSVLYCDTPVCWYEIKRVLMHLSRYTSL